MKDYTEGNENVSLLQTYPLSINIYISLYIYHLVKCQDINMHTVLLSTYCGKENEYITSNTMDELNKTIN